MFSFFLPPTSVSCALVVMTVGGSGLKRRGGGTGDLVTELPAAAQVVAGGIGKEDGICAFEACGTKGGEGFFEAEGEDTRAFFGEGGRAVSVG